MNNEKTRDDKYREIITGDIANTVLDLYKKVEKLEEANKALKEENKITVKFVKVGENAMMPTKGKTKKDTGMDVWTNSRETIIIRPCSKQFFKTGLAPILPEGWALTVADRSGVGSKGIKYLAGEIDNPYHGEIGIILANINSDKLVVFSNQEKKIVEACEWFDVRTKQFVAKEPTQEEYNSFKVINKSVIIVRYTTDAIAQLKMTRVPEVNVIEGTKEELEEKISKSERKTDGYGSTDGKQKN